MSDSLQASDAEREVLGAALVYYDDGGCVQLFHELPDVTAFALERHQLLYRVLRYLHDQGAPVDVPAITGAARELGIDPECLAVAEMLDGVPTLANLPHHARTIRDRHQRRRALATLTAARAKVEDLQTPLDETLGRVASALHDSDAPTERLSLAGSVNEALAAIELTARNGRAPGVSAGIRAVDRITGGFQNGDLAILGARPCDGKTHFACHTARAVAMHEGPVLLVTLEMPGWQLARRYLAMEADLDLKDLADGLDREAQIRAISLAAERVARWPIELDAFSSSPGQIRVSAERVKQQHGSLALIVVDYLQLMRSDLPSDNRVLEVGAVSRQLKRIAQTLNVPVVALSQLSRESAKQGREPVLTDLRDSGEIEQNADQVAFLVPVDRNDDQRHQPTDFLLEKNRHGTRGRVRLVLDRGTGRWHAEHSLTLAHNAA